MMDRSRDTGQSSRAEVTRRQSDDVIRRRVSSSDQPMKRPSLDEIERARAIDRGRYKMQKYQQEAKRYQKEDRDTFEEFEEQFENTITKLGDYVVQVASKNYYGEYENIIDVKNGKIIGGFNMHNNYINNNKLHLSESIFNQLYYTMRYLKMGILQFNLKCWYGNEVIDEETGKTANLFFPEERNVDGSVKEGVKTFLAGTDAFIALAGTPTGQSKFYLLAQHPKAFPGKEVTSITVIRYPDGQIDIEYEFGSQLEQKEKASPND